MVFKRISTIVALSFCQFLDFVHDVATPQVYLYEKQRRSDNSFAIENGLHHLAAAPFYLLLVVSHTLSACQHVVHDDNLFPLDIPRDTVVPFENMVFAALCLVQAFTLFKHIDIVQPRCQPRTVFADVPVESLEPPGILELVTARHEHDMTGSVVQLHGGHARFEELDTVYLAFFELIKGTAERPLFIVEQVGVP